MWYVSSSTIKWPRIAETDQSFVRTRRTIGWSIGKSLLGRNHGNTRNKNQHSSNESSVASVSPAATATAQDQTHDRVRIGEGVATDCQRIPPFSFTYRSHRVLTSTVFPAVVHPAFPRFPACSCYTLIRELIPLHNPLPLPPMRHPFLRFPPLYIPTYHTSPWKIWFVH